jgi:hypothetical protein
MAAADKPGGGARPGTRPLRSRKSRAPGFDQASDMPTANDNMLYLMFELERSIYMPTVIWSPALASSMLRRLETLVETVRRISQLAG